MSSKSNFSKNKQSRKSRKLPGRSNFTFKFRPTIKNKSGYSGDVSSVSASNSFDDIPDDNIELPTDIKIEITRKFTSISDLIKAKAMFRKHILTDIKQIVKYIISTSEFQGLANTNKVFYDRIIQFSNDESLSRKELYNLCLFMQILKANNLDNIPILYTVLIKKFTKYGNIERIQKIIEIFYEPKTINKSPICLYFISMVILIFLTWKQSEVNKFWEGYAKSDDIFAKIRDNFTNNFYHPKHPNEFTLRRLNELNANSVHKGYPCLPHHNVIEIKDFRNELSELEIENSMKKLSQHFSIWCLSEEVRNIILPNFDYQRMPHQIKISQILEIIKNL